MIRQLTDEQAEAISVRRWELVDDQSVTQADLNHFYQSDDWQSYLAHRWAKRVDHTAMSATYGA